MRAAFPSLIILLATVVQDVRAQPPGPARETEVVALSLTDAVTRAATQSEEVQLTRADVNAADTQVTAARAAALPHLTLSGGYVRTFQSAFRSGFSLPSGATFQPDPNASLEDRV